MIKNIVIVENNDVTLNVKEVKAGDIKVGHIVFHEDAICFVKHNTPSGQNGNGIYYTDLVMVNSNMGSIKLMVPVNRLFKTTIYNK